MKIKDAYSTKSQFEPGEAVSVTVEITGEEGASGELEAKILHLFNQVEELSREVTIPPEGLKEVNFSLTPEVDQTPRGFGVDLALFQGGNQVDKASTAFDVLEDWTESPRYGFMSDFPPDEDDELSRDKLDTLNRFNVNALQFYDWLYRHDSLIPPETEFVDPLGRNLSYETVKTKAGLTDRYGIDAMAYNAAYAASKDFHSDHEDWGLYDEDGAPYTLDLEGGSLYIMDPSEGSGWRSHIFEEYRKVLKDTEFDGLHIDQYGWPKSAYTKNGEEVGLQGVFPNFINSARKLTEEVDPSAKIAFNAVGNWPVQTLAPANQDIVYIELWPPDTTYKDVADIIENAHELGHGKKVVLAAYIPPSREITARLADAVIFSHGGYHIELGEGRGMLAGPYFPNYEEMGDDLYRVMKDYYRFRVRYEELLSPRNDAREQDFSLDSATESTKRKHDSVWIKTHRSDRYRVINMINLVNVDPFWKAPKSNQPTQFEDLEITADLSETNNIEKVYLSSPDFNSGRPKSTEFEIGEGEFKAQIPRLEYWNMLVLDTGGGR